MYTYSGIRKLSMNEISVRHNTGELVGCLKLYPDNTESYIEEYEWEDIVRHLELGGEIGYEL
mgnify:CR=1 FL=1